MMLLAIKEFLLFFAFNARPQIIKQQTTIIVLVTPVKKSLMSVFLIAIMISGLALVGNVHFGSAQNGTKVSGIIASDTTWSQANSPYSLTGPVAVNQGVTLTIEAGTTVNIGSYYIQINGTLVAIGNATKAIIFNGGTINFGQSSNSWNEQTQTGCIIEYSVPSCIIDISNASPLISNNQFTYSEYAYGDSRGIYVKGGSPIISNNTSNGYIWVNGGAGNVTGVALISENTINVSGITEGGIGCDSNNCNVIDNTLIGCVYAISVGGQAVGATIEDNLLYQNHAGIYFYNGPAGQAIIENNTIANNTIGIQLPSVSSTIIYNNLLNNQLSISLIDTGANTLQSNDINATYNYWGTTDQQAINQTIFDFKNNFNLGTVNFVPFLTAPNPQAPIYTPTTSPSPTPTSSSSPTSTPTVPEFPSQLLGISLVVSMIIVLSAVIIAKIRITVGPKVSRTLRGLTGEVKE